MWLGAGFQNQDSNVIQTQHPLDMFECITSRGRVSLSPEYRVSINLKPFKIAPIRTAHKATSKSHCTRTNLLLEATAHKLQIAPICTAHKVTSNSRTHCIRAQIAPVHTAHKATSEPNAQLLQSRTKPHTSFKISADELIQSRMSIQFAHALGTGKNQNAHGLGSNFLCRELLLRGSHNSAFFSL